MCFVVEPVTGTAAVSWEAPAQRSLALSLHSSGDRSIAGFAVAGSAPGIAAAGAAAAAAGVAKAEGGGGTPDGTEAIGSRR